MNAPPDSSLSRPAARSWALTILLVLSLGLTFFAACQRTPPRFAHATHLGTTCGPETGECLSCASCHQAAMLERPLLHPPGDDCQECHHDDERRVAASLALPRSAAAELAGTIEFNHEKHLRMSGLDGQCIKCHAGVVSEKGGPPFPPMSTCFGCHNHQEEWDQGVCVPCHHPAQLKTLFPRTYLRHGAAWTKGHGPAAANSTVQCAQCHSEDSCDDCHDVSDDLQVEVKKATQIGSDFTHPADFITRHAMEASASPATCLSCHQTQTCDSCHVQQGVSAARIGALNPHPPGWVGPSASAKGHHGRAAQRDILSCASCHDQGPETNCIECHRVGGGGGNPHPQGWRSTKTPSDMMCAYCHESQL